MKLVTSTALKIVGIYCLIQSVKYVRPLFHEFGFPHSDLISRVPFIAGLIVTLLLFIGMGRYLIVHSDYLAGRMLPEESDVEVSKVIKTNDLQALAFSVVGIVLITLAVSKLFQLSANIYTLYAWNLEDTTRYDISRNTIAYAIGILFELTVGILLFVFGGSVSNLWHAFKRRIQNERKEISDRP